MRLASTLAFQYVFATLVAAAGGVLALAAFDWPLVKGLLWGGVAAAVLLGTALGFTRPASTAAPTPARRVGGAVLGLFVFGNLAAALVIGWAYIAHFGGARSHPSRPPWRPPA